MPTVGCGEKTWPNIESVVRDAAHAAFATEQERSYRQLLLAAASRPGGLDISEIAYYAVGVNDELVVTTNPAAKTVHVEVRRR